MGLFERAQAVQCAARQRPGLLHKTRQLLAQLSGATPSDQRIFNREPEAEGPAPRDTDGRTPDQRLQGIVSALTRLRRGFEAPALLLSLLEQELGLDRAALLLYDPLRMVFAPWAALGYDPTTLQRLRIPPGSNSTFSRLAGGETLRLAEEREREVLRPLLSFREFSATRDASLVPFLHERKCIGILLISSQKPGTQYQEPGFYDSIARRAADLLYEARERHLEALFQDHRHLEALRQELFVRPDSLRALLKRSTETASRAGHPLLAIRLDFGEVIRTVQGAAPLLDAFRLREDIYGVVLALFSSVGTAAQLDSDHLLVLVHVLDPADPDLLTRHLESVLQRYFPSLAELEDLNLHPEVRTWSGPPNEAEQILDSFN